MAEQGALGGPVPGADGAASAATAYRRPKATPRRVVLVDRLADWTISVGGLAVIAAVFGIMAFLVEVVVPLFEGGSVTAAVHYPLPLPAGEAPPARPLAIATDEYGALGVALQADGRFESFLLASGRLLEAGRVDLGPAPVTAFARTARGGHLIVGFADGSVRLGRLDASSPVLRADALPAGLEALPTGRAPTGARSTRRSPAATGGAWRRCSSSRRRSRSRPRGGRSSPPTCGSAASAERPSRAFVGVDDAGAIGARPQRVAHQHADPRGHRHGDAPRAADAWPQGEVAAVLLTERADEVILAERERNARPLRRAQHRAARPRRVEGRRARHGADLEPRVPDRRAGAGRRSERRRRQRLVPGRAARRRHHRRSLPGPRPHPRAPARRRRQHGPEPAQQELRDRRRAGERLAAPRHERAGAAAPRRGAPGAGRRGRPLAPRRRRRSRSTTRARPRTGGSTCRTRRRRSTRSSARSGTRAIRSRAIPGSRRPAPTSSSRSSPSSR